MDMSPTNVGYKFRSPTARKLITKFPFVGQIGASSKMLLMFLLLTKSWDTCDFSPCISNYVCLCTCLLC